MLDLETAPLSRMPLALESATKEHARLSQEERRAWLAFVWIREDDQAFAPNWRKWLRANERLCAGAARLWELRIELLMGGRTGASDALRDVRPEAVASAALTPPSREADEVSLDPNPRPS
ncbi:hypothetical protein ACNI65_18055 [Roseateles sp. So40a]|uniref:hypothetical protein n=1 Tax=Roseateles sp. So40a TaxID=3400226 RepID=UPI003A8A04B2